MKHFYCILCLAFFSCVTKAQPLDGIDYIGILKYGGGYSTTTVADMPSFTYKRSSPELAALRKDYKLDSIAGFGNEESRVLNILHWVHNTVKHDGQNESGIAELNGRAILDAVRERGIGVSCGELATLLNDCYLAMGWASRKIYCLPLDSAKVDHDSHVINAVYLSSKQKWIWVDPTHDAYIMDETGELLSIEEVRARIISGKPLIVNPDANWNRRLSSVKSYYLLRYMAKNLYMLYTPLSSEFGYESKTSNTPVTYVYLYPRNHPGKIETKSEVFRHYIGKNATVYRITNAEEFWKKP